MRRGVHLLGAQEPLGMVDGAVCLRNHLDMLPLSEILLDFYHLSEHVGDAAVKTLGAQTEPAKQWVSRVLHTLRHEGYAPFFQQLLDWRSGLRGGKRKVADELINYVASRREMILYEKCEQHGWDVGQRADGIHVWRDDRSHQRSRPPLGHGKCRSDDGIGSPVSKHRPVGSILAEPTRP